MGAMVLGVRTNPAASHLPPICKGVRPEGKKLLAFPEEGTRRGALTSSKLSIMKKILG